MGKSLDEADKMIAEKLEKASSLDEVHEIMREAFALGLIKVTITSRCEYCGRQVKNIESHKCRGTRLAKRLLTEIPSLDEDDVYYIATAGRKAKSHGEWLELVKQEIIETFALKQQVKEYYSNKESNTERQRSCNE